MPGQTRSPSLINAATAMPPAGQIGATAPWLAKATDSFATSR